MPISRWLLYGLLLVTGASIVSGCYSAVTDYGQNRTIDLPSRQPTLTARMPTYLYTVRDPLFDPEPFEFSDSQPRLLVVGHVEIRQNGTPVQDAGAFVFNALEFESNVDPYFLFLGVGYINVRTWEVVSFVSGEWFAGEIFSGNRKLGRVDIASSDYTHGHCKRDHIFDPALFSYKILQLEDPEKVYYLGHITLNEKPRFPFFRSIEMTVRDLSEENATELRALVGEQEIELALLPNCPD